MTIEKMIDKSLAEVRDCMNGIYKILQPNNSKGRKWDKKWVPYIIRHCDYCGTIKAICYTNKIYKTAPYCSCKCKRADAPKTKSIKYNGIIYRIEDCPQSLKNIYTDPVKMWVENIKRSAKYKEENRSEINIKQNIKYHETKDLEAERERYYSDSEYRNKKLASQKKSRTNWNPEKKAEVKAYMHDYNKKPERQEVNKVQAYTRYHAKNKHNPEFRIKQRLRARLYDALVSQTDKKDKRSDEYGINYNENVSYLKNEANKLGMTINELFKNNYHIDHIIPIILYDLTDDTEVKKCFNVLNHRWILAEENISKGGRIRPQDIEIIKTLPKSIYPKGFNIKQYINKEK